MPSAKRRQVGRRERLRAQRQPVYPRSTQGREVMASRLASGPRR